MNRSDMKEWFKAIKQSQQSQLVNVKKQSSGLINEKRMLNETREIKNIQMSEFKMAIKAVGFDLESISSYLAVHSDDLADKLELVMKALAQEMINKYANPDYYMSDPAGIADPSFYSDDNDSEDY